MEGHPAIINSLQYPWVDNWPMAIFPLVVELNLVCRQRLGCLPWGTFEECNVFKIKDDDDDDYCCTCLNSWIARKWKHLGKMSLSNFLFIFSEIINCIPCIRAIVKTSDCLKIGTLSILTCTGATIGREPNLGHVILIPDPCVSKVRLMEGMNDIHCDADLFSIFVSY